MGKLVEIWQSVRNTPYWVQMLLWGIVGGGLVVALQNC